MKIKLSDTFNVVNGYGSSVKLEETIYLKDKETGELTGEVRIDKHGEYHDVGQAVKAYIDIVMNTSDKEYQSFKEYLEEYKRLRNEVIL